MISREPTIWFPTVRCGTGTDIFTETLAAELQKRGIRAEITWLPHRAEYAPWTVPVPKPPGWATVVHVNTWLHPRFIPCNLPVIATLHHSVHHPDLEPYKGWLRSTYHRHWIRRVEQSAMQRADKVVAVSRFASESARAAILDRPIDVIPNGVDVERFRPPAERAPHHPFRLLYVGSWMARKGVNLLAPIMRELGDDFELRYTSGPDADNDRAAMPANMYDIGRLRGTDAVVAAMQDADAFLFPSRSEGLPLSVLEAMACGLPVIATRGSALTEMVDDGITGRLCACDSVGGFSSAIRQLASGSPPYFPMVEAARQRALVRYHYTGVLNRYLEIYCVLSSRNKQHGR